MKIILAGEIDNSVVNGIGLRKVIFAQGCLHNCKGCFNPDTHNFKGGQIFKTKDIIEKINSDFIIDGVTFSGGDPFEQPEAFSQIAQFTNKNIWCYTGYTFEYIINNFDKYPWWVILLDNINVLVDGKFEIDKKDDLLKYRGSSNQRIINVKESLKQNKIIIMEV